MFLYARLVMDDLFSRTTAKSVTDQLDSRRFPETLEKAYVARKQPYSSILTFLAMNLSLIGCAKTIILGSQPKRSFLGWFVPNVH